MNRARKYGKLAVLILILLVAAQAGVSLLVRTHRMRSYLLAHLERAFGRPVAVGQFSAQILPIPRLDVDAITIGEDPAFGSEYFLRAEHMAASLRWWGLLHGHFEFGTMSLTRPSLILVRNTEGVWNLEGWLPPAQRTTTGTHVTYGPALPAEMANRLQKIEFDDGRINFKFAAEKRPFAFTNVSGSVEQVGTGRWELHLEAQPWRSGVTLQSTGTLQVSGEVAGTSARLQPASIRVNWEKVSLADMFRLVTGNDSGVRGEFALDGTASTGKAAASESSETGKWQFAMQARATRVHRWDLTERSDNPRINLNLKGLWNLAAGAGRVEELRIELPHSSGTGSGELELPEAGARGWAVHVDSAAVQAQDLLAWYRAFQPGVAEELSVDDLVTGSGTIRGWPLQLQEARIASKSGALRVPGLAQPVRIGELRGELRNLVFTMEPARLSLGATETEAVSNAKTPKIAGRTQTIPELQNIAELRLNHNCATGAGSLRMEGRIEKIESFFKLASAFGKTLNHGWELTGGVTSAMSWEWEHGLLQHPKWGGSITVAKAELQVAGLNLPIRLDEARLEWKKGLRSATIEKAGAFGAMWAGTMEEMPAAEDGELPGWKFQLHADRLDAADLDRWVGPRARPNWLQRLLPSLLGNSTTPANPSELLRRVSAEGELSADAIVIEQVKLSRAQAKLRLRDLHLEVKDAEAQWAGGGIQGSMRALFGAVPKYEISAEIDRANLAQLPWPARWAERWGGTASGKITLETKGVGREELLKQIAGSGDFTAKNVEFRGWDVAGSLDAGALRTGVSRWTSAGGEFTLKDRVVTLDAIHLDGSRVRTQLAGTIDFARTAKLTFSALPEDKRPAAARVPEGRTLELDGPLEAPRVAVKTPKAQEAKR